MLWLFITQKTVFFLLSSTAGLSHTELGRAPPSSPQSPPPLHGFNFIKDPRMNISIKAAVKYGAICHWPSQIYRSFSSHLRGKKMNKAPQDGSTPFKHPFPSPLKAVNLPPNYVHNNLKNTNHRDKSEEFHKLITFGECVHYKNIYIIKKIS